MHHIIQINFVLKSTNPAVFLQGDSGFEKHIDHLFEMTAYLVEKLKAHSDKFELLNDEPELTNVCFWYIPYRLRTMKAGPERCKLLGEVSIRGLDR